jgi:cysteine-rich repeat protein
MCTVQLQGWDCDVADPQSCQTVCGDGKRGIADEFKFAGVCLPEHTFADGCFVEACDDGNKETRKLDGCGPTCSVDAGFNCYLPIEGQFHVWFCCCNYQSLFPDYDLTLIIQLQSGAHLERATLLIQKLIALDGLVLGILPWMAIAQ